jgi:zinc transporter ZupT
MQNLLLSLFLIDFVGTAAGIYVLQSRHFDRKFMAISGGVMFGVGSVWIWPDIADRLGVTSALLAMSAGVVTLYVIDRFLFPLCPCCQHDSRHNCRVSPLALLPLAIAIAVHNAFDGWVAGLTANVGAVARSGITTGLIAHKVPEAALFGMMLRSATNEARDAMTCAILTASMILVGGLCHDWLPSVTPRALTVSLALTSANFLFLAGHIFGASANCLASGPLFCTWLSGWRAL